MMGKLILVGGLSGSGKTTLMRAAAQRIPNLEVLQTLTTRPMREGEINGQEYVFVTDAEYEARRQASKNWDHIDAYGFKYGADAGLIKQKFKRGTNIICTITPKAEDISLLEKAYGIKPITIWIEVPEAIAKARIVSDVVRSSRSGPKPAEGVFEYSFLPEHKLDTDIVKFCDVIRKIITNS